MKKVKRIKILLMLILVVLAMTNYSLSQQWVVVPSPNPSSSRNFLNGVYSISANDVWAVGSYDQLPSFTLIQHWDGVNWTTISSPNPAVRYNLLNAVQGWSSNNVYAVGYSAGIPSTPQMLILHWDGTSWTEQTTPTVTGGSSLQSIVIFGPNDIYAGGSKAVGSPGPTTGTLVTHWNGSSWDIEATPNQSQTRHNEITDMKGLSPNDIWAVGYSRNTGVGPGFYYQAMVLHKTGSGWNIVPIPQSIEDENFLYSIDIIAPDNIWASGNCNHGGVYRPLFFHYNGSTWTEVASPQGGYGFVHNSANDIWSTGSGFVHYDGLTWNLVSAPIPYGGAMGSMARISSTDIWAVGRYIDGEIMKTLTMHYDSSVPIELASFTAKVVGTAVQLNWKTATEVNNYGFDVESKNDQETEWEKIAFVQGHGNSNSPKDYFYIDKKVKSGKYSYRLKQVDYDGSFEYSNIIEVEVNNIPAQFSLYQNYPNPFNPSTIISYHVPVQNLVTIKVFNILGKEVATLVNEEKQPGVYELEFDASYLSSGIYFYTLRTNEFVETKKMSLIR